MAKKVHYFNIFITKEGKRTSYKLNHIFDKFIYPLSEKEKLKQCDKKYIALNNYIMPPATLSGSQGRIRTLALADYRDQKPFIGEKGTNKRDEIEEDVFELTRAVIFPDDYIIAVEYNHTGCKARHIIDYIKEFLPLDQDLDIEIKQIQKSGMFNKVMRSKNIKSIEVKIDTSFSGLLTNIYDYAKEEQKKKTPICTQVAESNVKAALDIGANDAFFGFSKGAKRKAKIEMQKDIINFISCLDINYPGLKKISVTFIDPDTNKEITKNLKQEAFIEDIIPDEQDYSADEALRDVMLELFAENKNAINKESGGTGSLYNINI